MKTWKQNREKKETIHQQNKFSGLKNCLPYYTLQNIKKSGGKKPTNNQKINFNTNSHKFSSLKVSQISPSVITKQKRAMCKNSAIVKLC